MNTTETKTDFEVDDDGVLSMAGFAVNTSRADYYEDVHYWRESREQFALAVEECQPLAWAVFDLYTAYREDLSAKLSAALANKTADKAYVAALNSQLDEMPEEPEEGVQDWLKAIDDAYHQNTIVPAITIWFESEPDWAFEDDYISDDATSQGAAFEYFREMPVENLKALGVKVVEGDRPAGTYYAAELKCGIDEGNARADKAGLPIRFIPQGTG